MQFKLDVTNGYMYCYAPEHPCANRSGVVAEHVYVMYKHIGRLFDKDECVHHVDRNKANNKLENLRLMTLSEHSRLHAIEDRGGEIVTLTCRCGKAFTFGKSLGLKYCSKRCFRESVKRFNPTVSELKELVWKMPVREVAKIFGVSDVAITKRCKSLGIEKPPQGYWITKMNIRP